MIDLGTTPREAALFQEPDPINLVTPESTVSPKESSVKAGMAMLAADSLGQPVDPTLIKDQIDRGNEDVIRTQLATTEAAQVAGVEAELSQKVLEDATISPAEKKAILEVPPEDPAVNALSAIETNAANHILTSAIHGNFSVAGIPEDQLKRQEDTLARGAILYNQLINAEQEAAQAPDGTFIKDIAESFVLNPVLERDIVSALQDNITDFNDIKSIRKTLYTAPPKEFAVLVNKINSTLDERGLAGTNQQNKINFWRKILNDGESSLSHFTSGLFQGLDLIPLVGGSLSVGGKLLRSIKAIDRGLVSVKKINGDLTGAAESAQNTKKAVEDGALTPDSPEAINALEEGLPSFMNVANEADGSLGISTLVNDFNKVVTSGRQTDKEVSAATDAAIESATKTINAKPASFIEDAVGTNVEVNVVRDVNKLGADKQGIHQIELTVDKEGVPFANKDVASIYAENVLGLAEDSYRLTDPAEGGVFIKVIQDVPSGNMQYTTVFDKVKGGLLSALSRDISIDPTTSLMIHLTSDSRSKLTEIGNKILAPIGKLKGDDVAAFNYLGVESRKRKLVIPEEDLKKMSFVKDGKTIQVTQPVIDAYHAAQAADHLHYNALNAQVVQDLNAAGYKNITFKTSKGDELDAANMNGKVMDTVPEPDLKTFYDISKGAEVAPASVADMQSKGYKVIKLHPKNELEVGDKSFGFVLAKEQEFVIGNLKRNQLEVIPGGRVMYDGSHTIQQLNVSKSAAGLDIVRRPTTHHIGDALEMEAGAKVLEELRQLYLKTKTTSMTDTEVTAAVQKITATSSSKIKTKANLDMAFEGVSSMKIKRKYNPNQPFEVVKVGGSSKRMDDLLSSQTSRYDIEDIRAATNLQDSLPMRGYGSRSKRTAEGLKQLNGEDAVLLNPSEIAARTMNQAAYQKAMRPLMKQVADRWVKTYGKMIPTEVKKGLTSEQVMDVASTSVLSVEGFSKAERNQALMFKAHWDNFRNVETISEKYLKGVMAGIADSVGLENPTSILGMRTKDLLTETNPFKFMKGYTFHTTLGVISPHNYILQGSAALGTAALEPLRSLRVSALMPVINAYLINPAGTSASFLKNAHRLPGVNLSEKHIKELLEDITNNGKYIVGDEHAYHHTVKPAAISKTMSEKASALSAAPFNWIEREMSIANYAISWIRWHEKNPGKMLRKQSAEVHGEVSDYADVLGFNMRNSGSNLTQGRGLVGAIMQMTSYPQHFIETFFRKELTLPQKTSLGLSQLALWGTGGVLGTSTLAGVSSYDVTQHLSDIIESLTGDKPSKTTINTIQNGMVNSLLIKEVLGSDLSFNNLGPGLFDQFLTQLGNKNIRRSDIAGIGLNKMAGIGGFALDLMRLTSTLSNPEVDTFDSMMRISNTFIENNVGTFSRLGMTSRGMRLGRYISSNGSSFDTEPISKFESLALMLGAKPQAMSQYWTAKNQLRARNDDIKGTIKMLNKEYQKTLMDIEMNPGTHQEKMDKFLRYMSFETTGFDKQAKNQIQMSVVTRDNTQMTSKIFMELLNTYGVEHPVTAQEGN